MMGKAFAATKESAAEKKEMKVEIPYRCSQQGCLVIHPPTVQEHTEALYRGQASAAFQREGLAPEGEEAWIPVTGSAIELLDDLHAKIKLGISYGGARTIKELQEHAEFARVTPAYLQEAGTRL
jgi:IMP dehydrogenase